MRIPFYQVDAFASQPFAGNPAAVCLLAEPMTEALMQSIAAEMNLAETAFLLPAGDAMGLRWFTPTVEVDLCGHATLASAHVLWESGRLGPDRRAEFDTRSGRLTAERAGAAIELDFPAEPAAATAEPTGLVEALGARPIYVGQNRMDYLVEIEDAGTLRSLRPDLARLADIPVRGIIVTSRSDDPRYDFLSRFFAPAAGIPEDPVTGSAHCCLAPYWAARLGKTDMQGYQASARGGTVGVGLEGDRVRLIGHAVTVVVGGLVLDP